MAAAAILNFGKCQ